jgi:hypothetical protein
MDGRNTVIDIHRIPVPKCALPARQTAEEIQMVTLRRPTRPGDIIAMFVFLLPLIGKTDVLAQSVFYDAKALVTASEWLRVNCAEVDTANPIVKGLRAFMGKPFDLGTPAPEAMKIRQFCDSLAKDITKRQGTKSYPGSLVSSAASAVASLGGVPISGEVLDAATSFLMDRAQAELAASLLTALRKQMDAKIAGNFTIRDAFPCTYRLIANPQLGFLSSNVGKTFKRAFEQDASNLFNLVGPLSAGQITDKYRVAYRVFSCLATGLEYLEEGTPATDVLSLLAGTDTLDRYGVKVDSLDRSSWAGD